MKLTETKEVEVTLPKYFKSDGAYYRYNEENDEFTYIKCYLHSKPSIIGGASSETINASDITEVTEKEFKEYFCMAIYEIAGFEINLD